MGRVAIRHSLVSLHTLEPTLANRMVNGSESCLGRHRIVKMESVRLRRRTSNVASVSEALNCASASSRVSMCSSTTMISSLSPPPPPSR